MNRYSLPALLLSLLFSSHASAGDLYWPLACTPGDDKCFSNIGYPDVDGNGIAFNCGTPGYTGHKGTDVGVYNSAVASGTDVLAAADGIVEWVWDGKYDNCDFSASDHPAHPDCVIPASDDYVPGSSNGVRVCTPLGDYCPNGSGQCFWCFDGGNVVAIKHPDTSIFLTHYSHMKTNSILVQPGDTVKAGEKIAEVASAGRSTGPHLHFEIWESTYNDAAEPWPGPCGINTGASLWKYETAWVAPAFSLPDDKWHQISVPALPLNGLNTVASVYGDDIAGALGTSWAMFRYDPEIVDYVPLDSGNPIRSGESYWIKQLTGAATEMDTPFSSETVPTEADPACSAPDSQCFAYTLQPTEANVQWHLVGNPFGKEIRLDAVRIKSETGACVNGCTLDEANSADIVFGSLFAFGTGPGYDTLDADDLLKPWAGAWLATRASALSHGATLLWPLP